MLQRTTMKQASASPMKSIKSKIQKEKYFSKTIDKIQKAWYNIITGYYSRNQRTKRKDQVIKMGIKFSKYRCSLMGTVAAIALTLLLGGQADANDRSTDIKTEQPAITTEVVTTCTTTMTTTTATTASTMTTTMQTTTIVPETTVPIETEIIEEQKVIVEDAEEEELPTEEVAVEETADDEIVVEDTPLTMPLSEQDYILIANVVSHEAGSSWISTYERTQIVAAIMNRVADTRFPSTVDEVVHQPGQMFDVPYYRVDYSGIGYEPIDEAIALYFSSPSDYGSINCWCGNGTNNYFYTI